MGNCDKKSTGNREFTGNCPYILYINSQFTVLLRIFCKFTGNWPFFYEIYGIFPGKFAAGTCPVIWKNGAFPGSKFSGEYTANLVKNGQLPVKSAKEP